MDHTATRRNRSQLRNQLVRQRRTVVYKNNSFGPAFAEANHQAPCSVHPEPRREAGDFVFSNKNLQVPALKIFANDQASHARENPRLRSRRRLPTMELLL
jgi:hypothetical protein